MHGIGHTLFRLLIQGLHRDDWRSWFPTDPCSSHCTNTDENTYSAATILLASIRVIFVWTERHLYIQNYIGLIAI